MLFFVLPPHYTRVVNSSYVTCGVIMVINWGGAVRCSLNLSKCSGTFSNVLITILNPGILISVNQTTFVGVCPWKPPRGPFIIFTQTAKTVCSNPHQLQKEEHLKEA